MGEKSFWLFISFGNGAIKPRWYRFRRRITLVEVGYV